MKKETIEKRVNTQLQKWKSKTDSLKAQLNTGWEKALDEFEEQKSNTAKWVDKAEKVISDVKKESKEEAADLRSSLEHLRVQAALAKAESLDALEKQRDKMDKGLHDLKRKMDKTISKADSLKNQALDQIEKERTELSDQIELLSWKIKLEKQKATSQWKNKAAELSGKLKKIEGQMEKAANIGSEKWEDASTEIKKSWNELKGTITSN